MAANTNPIFVRKGNISANGGTTMPTDLLTAVGDFTGASANHVLIHTAGAEGSFVRNIKFVSNGTNVATDVRLYANNGATNTIATNNRPIGNMSLPATTASNTVAMPDPELPVGVLLPPNFRLYAGILTTVAAGWAATAITGDH